MLEITQQGLFVRRIWVYLVGRAPSRPFRPFADCADERTRLALLDHAKPVCCRPLPEFGLWRLPSPVQACKGQQGIALAFLLPCFALCARCALGWLWWCPNAGRTPDSLQPLC